MRSFFCEKCRLEFDLDGDFEEEDNMVFCPRCKVNLALILPETPERILMREKRLLELRRKEQKKMFQLLLGTLAILTVVNILLVTGGKSYFLMLAAGLIAGIPAGLWSRRITLDRSFRIGVLASVVYLLVLAVDMTVLYCSGKLVLSSALRNLTGGIITAWIFAVFEKNS